MMLPTLYIEGNTLYCKFYGALTGKLSLLKYENGTWKTLFTQKITGWYSNKWQGIPIIYNIQNTIIKKYGYGKYKVEFTGTWSYNGKKYGLGMDKIFTKEPEKSTEYKSSSKPKQIKESKKSGVKNMVNYNGRNICFGDYVIWDSANNRFLCFDTINELNEALNKFGYVKNHVAVKSGVYTQYGYFSNSQLYDLYLRYRFPDVYTKTGQKLAENNWKEYQNNLEVFRQKLRQNPQVRKEIYEGNKQYIKQSKQLAVNEIQKQYNVSNQQMNNPTIKELVNKIAELNEKIQELEQSGSPLLQKAMNLYSELVNELMKLKSQSQSVASSMIPTTSVNIAAALQAIIPLIFIIIIVIMLIKLVR